MFFLPLFVLILKTNLYLKFLLCEFKVYFSQAVNNFGLGPTNSKRQIVVLQKRQNISEKVEFHSAEFMKVPTLLTEYYLFYVVLKEYFLIPDIVLMEFCNL